MPDPTPEEVTAAGLLGLVVEKEVKPNPNGQHGPPAWFVYGMAWVKVSHWRHRGRLAALGSYVPGTGRWWANGEAGSGSWADAVPAFLRAGQVIARRAA